MTADSPGGDRSAVLEDLKKTLVEVADGKLDGIEIDPTGDVFEHGYVDSLSAVMFLSHIAERYGVEIDDLELVEQYSTLDHMTDLLTGSTGLTWEPYDFRVQMPHMAPGEKLSEVELLKILAAYQWESISRALCRRPPELVNEQKERLYGSVIDVELHLGQKLGMEILGEDVVVHVRNRVRFFAKKFVEGLFIIDDEEIPDERLAPLVSREDVRALDTSWGCMTNAFIARAGGNVRLRVFRPVGVESSNAKETKETPIGIVEQGRVQSSGQVEGFEPDLQRGYALEAVHPGRILYPIVTESDLNGAGLVYFARYEAMMNHGERLFLSDQLAHPVSRDLISCLSTEHRRAYFFANASPTDVVEIRISGRALPPGHFELPDIPSGYRVPMKMLFRIDLYRTSDNVLMASSVVRKSLNVPGSAKSVLNEAQRWISRIG